MIKYMSNKVLFIAQTEEMIMPRQYTIGFCNLDEKNTFAVTVRESLERAAANHPQIDLVIRDNALSSEQATKNIQEFATLPVDLAIVFHIDQRAGFNLVMPLRFKQIPTICIDIPYPVTYFYGVDNEYMGRIAGEAFADWVIQHWDGQIERILVATTRNVLEHVNQRFTSALDVLAEKVSFSTEHIMYVDSDMENGAAAVAIKPIIDRWQDQRRIAILCINDFVAEGVLDGVRQLGRERDVAILSYDGTPFAQKELANPESCLIVSPTVSPEKYGDDLMAMALKILNGESVPMQNPVKAVNLVRGSE